MNHIKQLRGSVFQTDFIQALAIPHIDAPMLSRFEQGKCNPVPADARKIADTLGKPLAEIYDAADLDYGIGRGNAENATRTLASGKKDLRSKVTVRKCYRVSKSTAEWLTPDYFKACGYRHGQHWFDLCVFRLQQQYYAIQKRKAASDGQTSSAAKENYTA